MDAIKDLLIVKFVLVFFGSFIWGVVSFYLVKEATLYVHEELFNSKPDMKVIITSWAGMNALSLVITLYLEGVC